MKTKELRLGNLLIDATKEIWPVKVIDSTMTKITAKPIKLTEDWCLRLGFKRFNNALCKDTDMGQFEIWYPGKGWDMTFITENFNIKLRYVHQLQNLFFALTGKELSI